MSDSLRHHEPHHAKPPCASPTPRACSNSCLSSQWCLPTILTSVSPSPPVFSLSQHQDLFQWVGFLQQYWPKYWSFSFSISPSNEYSELISFRMDWFDLLALQGTFKSLLQQHSSKDQFFGAQTSLSFIISQSLPKLMSTELVMTPNHLILLLPSIFPSIRVFSNESVVHIRWPKYWSFSFSISASSEYSGLISLRIDWFDHFAVQRTLKSLLQHHSSKASVFSLLYGPTLTSVHDC